MYWDGLNSSKFGRTKLVIPKTNRINKGIVILIEVLILMIRLLKKEKYILGRIEVRSIDLNPN